MKKLLLATLMLVSQISFAQVLPVEEGALVIKAVRDSLAAKDLSCINVLNGEQSIKASALNWIIFEGSTVRIDESDQPVVTILKAQSADIEAVAYVTTSPDFTEVVHLRLTRSQLSKESRNVGTIIRPRYEEVISRKSIEDLECQ